MFNVNTNLKGKLALSPPHLNFLSTYSVRDDKDKDIVIILKCHLLIEELLVSFVSKRMKKPKKLENFKFHHYLCLAKALDEVHDDSWIWLAIEKLNAMRNKLAHSLKPAGFKELKENFIKIVTTKSGFSKPKENLAEGFEELFVALMRLYVSLFSKLR